MKSYERRIHFTDNYGQGAIDVDNREDYNETYKNLLEDPTVEDIWVEDLNEEEY